MVLAQIIRRRGYGYELNDRLREWSEALDLSHSAIYAALKKLEREELIVEVERELSEVSGQHPNPRVIYEATPKEHAHFQEWKSRTPRKAPLREELHMQLMVAEDEDIPALVSSLRQMEEDCRAHWARILDSPLDSHGSSDPRVSSFGAALVQDGLMSHLQATMEWAQRSRRALENRLGERATGVPGRHRP